MLDKVLETCKRLSNSSLYVTINEDRIKEVAKKLEGLEFKHWIVKTENRLLKLPIEDQVNFLLIFDSIDFSFWGNPKWTVELKSGKKEDGAYALMEALLEYFEDTKNLDFTKVSFEEFKKILKGNVEIPLLEERYNIVQNVSKVVNEKMKSSFYDYIKDVHDDKTLFEIIINNFKSFEDKRMVECQEVYFYKLAQLLTSDILSLRKEAENIDVDLSNLKGCSDYKIPQILRGLGVINYSEELSNMVDNKKILGENSRFEVEIRASVIVSIDRIKEELNGRLLSIEINDLLWELSHDKAIELKPYHLTRTTSY